MNCYLWLVLTYDSMENCGIRINSTRAVRNFTRLSPHENFLAPFRAINPEYHHAIISPNTKFNPK